MATTIGSFLVKLLFDDGQFQEGTADAEKRLEGFGASLSKVGAMIDGAVVTGLKAATAAMAAFGAVSVKVGADFEQSITTVAAVSGASRDELEALTEQARNLGATTAFSASQAADGMIELARAGLTPAETIAASESALLLAGASASSMTEATSILASTMSQFQLPASESARIADVFSTAMNNSQLSMGSLREAMKFAGVTGQQFGMTLEQTTAAVAQFRNLGLEGSLAGNAFKMAMLEATKQSSKKEAALASLGLTFEDINPEIKSFGEIMTTVGEAGIGATEAAVIFGARAGIAVAGVSEQFAKGTSTFDELVVKLEDSAGETATTYETMTDTVSGQTAIVRSAFEELALVTFDTFGGGLKDLLSEIAATIAFVAADFSQVSGGLAMTFDQSIRAAIEYLKANREAIAVAFRNFAEAAGQVVVMLGRIIPLLDDVGRLIVAVFVANKVRVFVAALVAMVNTLLGAVTATGGVRVALKLLYAELVVMSGGTLALVAAIGTLVVTLGALVMGSDDAADAADRLREAQERQESVEKAQHDARMTRATELQASTQRATLGLAARLAEEDRLTAGLERALDAAGRMSAETIEQGLQQGKLLEVMLEGEQVVLDYAGAVELAKLGGEEQAAANEAMAGAFATVGSRVFEAQQALEELNSVQTEYNRLVESGRDGVRGTSFAFSQVASSVEDYRTKLAAATKELDDAQKAQTELAQAANRVGREAQIAAAKGRQRDKERDAAAKKAAADADKVAEAYRRATEAREKFEQSIVRESIKLSGDAAAQAVANLRVRLEQANKVFDAEVEAARKAGGDIEAIERRREIALGAIRAQEVRAVGLATKEKIEAVREQIRTEEAALRQSQITRRAEVEAQTRAEIALAEKAGVGVRLARQRQAEALSALTKLEAKEDAEFQQAREKEAARTSAAIAALIGNESRVIEDLLRKRERAIFGFQRRRLDSTIEFARKRAEANQRFDQFIADNADLTSDQLAAIEQARADEMGEIDEDEKEERRRRNLKLLADIGKATVAAVAATARATINIAKKAGSALSGLFSSFTGGLSLSSLSGGIEEVLSAVEDSGGSMDLAAAAEDFVDGLIGNAVRFVDALVTAAPVIVQELGEQLPGLISKVSEAIPDVVQAIAQNIGPVLDAIVAGIPLLIEGIVAALPFVIDAILSFLTEDLPRLLETLAPLVAELIGQVLQAIPQIIEALLAAVPDVVTIVVDAIEQVLTTIPDIIRTIVEALPAIILSLTSGIGDIIAAVFDAIPLILNELIAGLPSIFSALVEGLLGIIIRIVQELPALLDSLLTEVIPNLIEGLILAVAAIVEQVFVALPEIVNAIVMLIPQLITSIIEMIPRIILALVASLPTLISSLITGVLTAIPQIVIALIAALPAIVVALVEGLVVELIAKLPFIVGQLIVALVQGIIDGIKGFVDAFRRIFKEALGFVGDLFGKDEEGRGIVRKTGKAIGDGAKKLVDGVKNLFNDTPGVMRVGREPAAAMFAPNDLFVAAKDPMDLARMALAEVGSAVGSRASSSTARTPPPMPNRSPSSGQQAPIDIAVIAEGRVLDAVQVQALDRGHAPRMEQRLRKASGVTVGLDRGRRNPYSR